MPTTITSRLAYKEVDRLSWYSRIRRHMLDGSEWCIADLAHELHAEKSTISARLNEMREDDSIEETSKKRSKTTGIMSNHYKLRQQDSLF